MPFTNAAKDGAPFAQVATAAAYPVLTQLPGTQAGFVQLLRDLPALIASLRAGRLNAGGSFVLLPGTQTRLLDPRIGPTTQIVLTPCDAAAAAVQIYVANKSPGRAELVHTPAAGGEKFECLILG